MRKPTLSNIKRKHTKMEKSKNNKEYTTEVSDVSRLRLPNELFS